MLADSELGDKAVARPMFRGARSDSMVRNQVCRGRPERRCQSLGRGVTLARRARQWSMEASARAMWPKNQRQIVHLKYGRRQHCRFAY